MSKYEDILRKSICEKNTDYTHTKIGSKELGIYGNIYKIDNINEFYNKYYQHVFINGNKEYITEKQLIEDGPLLIDIDIRYEETVNERKYTDEHIIDLINIITYKLSDIYNFDNNSEISVFVMEKDKINKTDKKVKDGIHLLFTIKMHKAAQMILRDEILDDVRSSWDDLPLTNSADDLIDEGIIKGTVNWQLYGSRKPGNDSYKLTNYYTLSYNKDDNEWSTAKNNLSKFNIKDNLFKLSARNNEHNGYEVNENYCRKFEDYKNKLSNKERKTKLKLVDNINLDYFDYSKINNMKTLDNLIEKMFDDLTPSEYELKEIHDFTLALSEKYYGQNSYSNWIRVGWALKNKNKKLFLTWLKMSTKSKEFNWYEVPKFYDMWKTFDENNPDGLSERSIMYWLKNENIQEFNKIRRETISFYVEQTVDKSTDFDLATVLYQLYKDRFVCVSIKNNIWYEYKNHKWFENDSGNSLRMKISTEMYDLYQNKSQTLIELLNKMDNSNENHEKLLIKCNKVSDICVNLKKTNPKNNIMKEARDIFYDKDFINKLDSNPYLLCFNNFVIDFKEKKYRKGQPDDFISKSTNIDYLPYENVEKELSNIKDEINNFIDSLFPDEELKNYIWEHLASCMIGTNLNQTFNIYTGSGCNGKSVLVELMSRILGDYKGVIPVSLITQNRGSIGSASPEVVQLMGTRYAVMQEPKKGDKINEGIMKEITGGDPIQARALFKEAVTFIPQFKLVVCTNTLFDIKSNDDGTWRRIRVCDFKSKFTENPYIDFPKENYPHQYKIDKKLTEKFNIWGPIFASMLVELAFKLGGKVTDCKAVLSTSDKYRQDQDYLAEFAKEKIIKQKDGKIKKTEIMEEFKNWYITNYGRATLPNGREVTEYMDRLYGKCNKGKWHNVAIVYEDDEEEEFDNTDED
jgi:P4 family phage/plasmid primase-like protien